MSKPKVWTLPELLDRIWMLSRGKRTAVRVAEKGVSVKVASPFGGTYDEEIAPPTIATKRVVTGWDEDYKPRTYDLNKISASSAAALYERIKTEKARDRNRSAALVAFAKQEESQRVDSKPRKPVVYRVFADTEVDQALVGGWTLYGSAVSWFDGSICYTLQPMVLHED